MELLELLVNFVNEALVSHPICTCFLLVHMLYFNLVYGSLCCEKRWYAWWSPIYLVLFLLPWKNNLRKTLLGFVLENVLPDVLFCRVLASSFLLKSLSFLSLVLCVVWGSVPTSLIDRWLSSFPDITCGRDCLLSCTLLPPVSEINWL